jgi:hypothetical protein
MNPDDIASRVGCFGMGVFCHDLFDWFGVGWPRALTEPRERFELISSVRLITLKLYRLALTGAQHEWDNIVIEGATFAAGAAMPFKLATQNETPASAIGKLSSDTFAAQTKISHFMPDGRVVALHFKPGMIGLDRAIVVRLGGALDWRQRG